MKAFVYIVLFGTLAQAWRWPWQNAAESKFNIFERREKNMLTISGHVSKGTCLFDSLYKNSLHRDTNCVKGNAF